MKIGKTTLTESKIFEECIASVPPHIDHDVREISRAIDRAYYLGRRNQQAEIDELVDALSGCVAWMETWLAVTEMTGKKDDPLYATLLKARQVLKNNRKK